MTQFIGLDVGHETCHLSVVDEQGELIEQHQVRTDRRTLQRTLRGFERTRVVLETGGETSWVSRVIEEAGHEAWACHARRLRLIAESTLKCDRLDAEVLARLCRLSAVDERLLPAVHRRGEAAERVRALLRVRSTLVRQRTACVNAARGLARSQGHRLPGVKPRTLSQHVQRSQRLPAELRQLVQPLLDNVAALTVGIDQLNARIDQLGQADPVVQRLRAIEGVGPLTALAFVSCLEDPNRFRRSRDVGAYLGLRPRLRQSGGTRQEGRITREGDTQLRHVLVQAAHALLNSKKDSDLKRWGSQLQRRLGRQKAVVAVARKLAIVMHRVWITGEEYRPRRAPLTH